MEINTLADFISEISNLEEYYFRGECKNIRIIVTWRVDIDG